MIKNNLTPIANKVVSLLEQNGIQEYELLSVLSNIFHDCKNNMVTTVSIEESYFNLLKDMVWYNFERKDNSSTLEDFGKTYKCFMFSCDEENVIQFESIENIKMELLDIKDKLEKTDALLVQLSGNEDLFNTKATIHFVDKRKNSVKKNTRKKKNELLCVINDSLSAHKMEQIKINSVIDELLLSLEKAEKNHTELRIEFIA